jgi:hypothetical protein
MNKNKLLVSIGLVLVVLILGGLSFIGGHQTALRDLSFKNISATQAAQAMKNDEFYSDYNENVLVIHGTISSLSEQGAATLIGLKASSNYKTVCKLGSDSSSFKVGDHIAIEALGGTALRQTSGVLLQNCINV